MFSTKQNNRTFKQRHRVREKTLGKDLSLPPNMICHALLGKNFELKSKTKRQVEKRKSCKLPNKMESLRAQKALGQ